MPAAKAICSSQLRSSSGMSGPSRCPMEWSRCASGSITQIRETDVAELRYQAGRPLKVSGLKQLQLLLCSVLHPLNEPDQHVASVVERPSPLPPDEGNGECVSFVRLGLLHPRCIQRTRLSSESLQFHGGYAGDRAGVDCLFLQPAGVFEETPDALDRRLAGLVLHPLPCGLAASLRLVEEAVDTSSCGHIESFADAPVIKPVDRRSRRAGGTEQRGEPGQFITVAVSVPQSRY